MSDSPGTVQLMTKLHDVLYPTMQSSIHSSSETLCRRTRGAPLMRAFCGSSPGRFLRANKALTRAAIACDLSSITAENAVGSAEGLQAGKAAWPLAVAAGLMLLSSLKPFSGGSVLRLRSQQQQLSVSQLQYLPSVNHTTLLSDKTIGLLCQDVRRVTFESNS